MNKFKIGSLVEYKLYLTKTSKKIYGIVTATTDEQIMIYWLKAKKTEIWGLQEEYMRWIRVLNE